MEDEICRKCLQPIYIQRWAVKQSTKKGKEIKTPVWRHRLQTQPGAMCANGTTAALPPDKEYRE